jgi:hypothetical protein
MILWKKFLDDSIKSNKIGKHISGWKDQICNYMIDIEFIRTFKCHKCSSGQEKKINQGFAEI